MMGLPRKKEEKAKEKGSAMPIYEYKCNRCHREFSCLLVHSEQSDRVICSFCETKNVKRILSSFSVHQTEESRLSSFDTSKPQGSGFYNDSRNIGLFAKKKMRDLGVDLGPQMDEIVEKGRSGKILDDYQK
jgi:putative FmdB family regulatory protein